MRRRTTHRRHALAALLTGALLLVAPLAAGAAATPLSPPVIHESFTLLPCPAHPQSTLDYEGCAEHRIVHLDGRIDVVSRAIFGRLFDDAARRRFIAASKAWLAYRQADCTSMSDRYEGGTLAGLLAANCTAGRSADRLTELEAFDRSLAQP